MAPSSDSTEKEKDKDKDKDKDKGSSAPSPSSNSSSNSSNSSSQSSPTPHSSTPPPPNSSPPPPQKSPPPPKAPPPSPSHPPPPPSPPPSPASPPPPSEESPSPPPPKSPPSPPPPLPKGSPPSPPNEEESPTREDFPTPSPPHSPRPPSSSSSSSSSKSPPSHQSPKADDYQDSSSPPSPPPPSTSTSTSFSPPPPISSSSSSSSSPPTPPSSSPSPPSDLLTTTTGFIPKASESPGEHVMEYSIVHSPSHPHDQAARIGIALGTVAAVLLTGFILAIVFVRRRRRKLYNSMYMVPSAFASTPDTGSSFHVKPSPNGASPDGIGNSKTWFTYEELASATDGFDSKNIIGAGGFGCVYKGFLQDGREVAIKKLKDNSGQGDREFRAEVEIISRVHHRHLVSLVGYCINDQQRLLVYEFVPNNTLYHHLHSPSKAPMNWALRVRVACGSARGIAYLHEDCHPRIIHRDIKSANILLANNWEAKVSDFGLAKLAQELESNTHVSTRVMGTFGYMAPEYATSGKLTEKSDVFSFGVVLLELITGRKPVDDTRPLGDESLVEWARPLMSEALESQNFEELADPRLEGNYDRGEMFRMIEAAAACVRHSASKRPKMSQVVRALDTMGDLSNGVKPGESEIIDSREQSVQIRMFRRMTFESQDYSSDNYTSQSSWPSGGISGGTHGAVSGQAGRPSGQT